MVSNLQPVDECEGINFLRTVENFGELILEEIEVRLEAVSLPLFNGEEVVVVPLSLMAGGILGGERFSHLSEVVE